MYLGCETNSDLGVEGLVIKIFFWTLSSKIQAPNEKTIYLVTLDRGLRMQIMKLTSAYIEGVPFGLSTTTSLRILKILMRSQII